MKKTLIALAGAVLLLAVALFIDQHRDASRQADRHAFDTTRKADVNYLKVILQKDTSELFKSGEKWVAAPDSFPVDTGKISKGLTYLLGLQNKEIVSTNPSRLAEYGLDSAQAKHVEWRDANGKEFRVVIGKTSGADYSSTYWKWEDKPEVYSTPGSFGYDIASRSSDWKDRTFVAVEPSDIRSLEVDWRDSADHPVHYKLEEAVKDSVLRMMEPDTASIRKSDAETLLNQSGQFSIDDFVAPGDTNLAKARLDTPMVDIRIGLKNGKTYEIKGGRTFDNFVYTRHPVLNRTVKISDWRFKPFKRQPYELMADTARARSLMPPPPVVKKTATAKKIKKKS